MAIARKFFVASALIFTVQAAVGGLRSQSAPEHIHLEVSPPEEADQCIWIEKNGEETLGEYIIAIKHSVDIKEKLHNALVSVSDPNSATYGQYFTREQVTKLITGQDNDRATKLLSWLESLGAQDARIRRSGDYITARLPPPYKTPNDLHIPNDMQDIIAGVSVRITNYANGWMPITEDLQEKTFQTVNKVSLENGDWAGSPNAQKSKYGMPTTLKASRSTFGGFKNRQMVWGPGEYGFLKSDLEQFWEAFGIDTDASTVKVWGYNYRDASGANFGEGSLDIQLITGMSPGVETIFANTNKTSILDYSYGLGHAFLEWLDMMADMDDACLPRVVSLSLGSLSWDACHLLCTEAIKLDTSIRPKDCEKYLGEQFQVCQFTSGDIEERVNIEFMKLGLRGVTILAATGDGGSHFSFKPFGSDKLGKVLNEVSCAHHLPTFPAESPYVLAVGGLQWASSWFGRPKVPFTYWAQGGGGGAGFSLRFKQPHFQSETIAAYLNSTDKPTTSAFSPDKRGYPDVSALAMGGIPSMIGGRMRETGGTSASTPTIAGFISMVNDLRLSRNLPVLGFVNPRIYSMPNSAFIDVVKGNSGVFCESNGFEAGEGWDAVTGFGAPWWPAWIDHLGRD